MNRDIEQLLESGLAYQSIFVGADGEDYSGAVYGEESGMMVGVEHGMTDGKEDGRYWRKSGIRQYGFA